MEERDDSKWLLLILVAVIGWLIWKGRQKALASPDTALKAIGNPGTTVLQLEPAKTTKLLAMKVIVKKAGTPVQFPSGKVPSGEVRLSTRGNTGTVYIGDSYVGVKSTTHRFGVVKDKDFPYKVTELGILWLDADTDADYCEVLGEVYG